MLDAAIVAGLAGILLAIAVPLIRGAVMRQRTAECARKIMRAADAFDSYAVSCGHYPQSQQDPGITEALMKSTFVRYGIDWWRAKTELGGQWDWYSNGQSASVVITGADIPERQMAKLDALLDDGVLETGAFQRHVGRYHYIIRDHVL